jgi:tellurite resistance protein TehA-like permease
VTIVAHATALRLRPLLGLEHPREVVRQFTPNWFAVTMGTGVLALALVQLPIQAPGLRAVAEGLWIFNIGLFVIFSALSPACRRQTWRRRAGWRSAPSEREPLASWSSARPRPRYWAKGLGAYASAIEDVGLIGAILLWGYGVWWVAMAALITWKYLREGLPFNMGWWGYTFPIGVYALCTLRLHQVQPIGALAIYGTALVVVLAVLGTIIGARTLAGAWRGDLFLSP